MSRLFLYAPLAIFALLAAWFAIGLRHDPSRIPSVLIDKPLPEFSLPAIDGHDNALSSDDVVGKVALVNVFASWCIPCAIEHPQLMKNCRGGRHPDCGCELEGKTG